MPNKTAAAVAAPGASISNDLPARKKLVSRIAERFGVDDTKLLGTLKATAFSQGKGKDGKPPPEVTDEQMMALLVVADQYKLNPFTKEIYAFADSARGGIVPIVSVDGWTRIINERPELAAIEFEYSDDNADDPWIACTITRHDRAKPLTVREYGKECYRDTGPWNSHPRRMLRHKVLIQCARIAFGFAGIYDADEAERIRDARTVEGQVVSSHKAGTTAPRAIESTANEQHDAPAPSGAITAETATALRQRLEQFGVPEARLLTKFGVAALEDLHFDSVNAIYDWIPQAAREL